MKPKPILKPTSCPHSKVARSQEGKYLVTKCEKCDVTLRREITQLSAGENKKVSE